MSIFLILLEKTYKCVWERWKSVEWIPSTQKMEQFPSNDISRCWNIGQKSFQSCLDWVLKRQQWKWGRKVIFESVNCFFYYTSFDWLNIEVTVVVRQKKETFALPHRTQNCSPPFLKILYILKTVLKNLFQEIHT